MYLAFNGFASQIPFFYGRAAFCRTRLEGTCYLLSKDSVPLFPRSGLETDLFIRRFQSPNWKSFSQFPLSKRTYFSALRLWPIICPLSSSSSSSTSSGHAAQWPAFPSPFTRSQVMECRQPSAFILTWIRYFVQQAGREELTFIHIPLLTVNLWGLLVQTPKGKGN